MKGGEARVKQVHRKKVSREDVLALEEIERIRRNGFNPRGELVEELIQTSGPVRAARIMRLLARADRAIFEQVH